jgi:hypothetical protein
LGRIAADGRADDGEDARADNGADAQCSEGDGAQSFFEGVLGTLRVGDELVDGLGGEDLSGQGCVSSVKIYRIVMIVSGSSPGRILCERIFVWGGRCVGYPRRSVRRRTDEGDGRCACT